MRDQRLQMTISVAVADQIQRRTIHCDHLKMKRWMKLNRSAALVLVLALSEIAIACERLLGTRTVMR